MSQARIIEEARKISTQPSTRPSRRGDLGVGIATFLFLALFAFLSLYRQSPVAAAPASAPPSEFSSGRAMNHLKIITQSPHPIGSPEHSLVRDYIIKELSANGLNPEVQKTTGVNEEWGRPVAAGTVENILGRLKGADSGKAVMIVGHYDSVATAYGASDDGAAVVAMLETLRALKAGPPLKNDVIFLFTDGEEAGLLGAKAFVTEHPWAKDVGLLFNYEARGNGGPAIMFETSDDNGWLIKEFAKASPNPIAHSLAYEIYKLLPNNTDFTVFKNAGLAGLNFAYIDGPAHYHTLLDSFDRIDESSIQHTGSYALALARHFGNLGPANTREPNAVYFDLLGLTLLHYPSGLVISLTALIALSFVALLVIGFRRNRLTLSGIALGALAFLASVSVTWAIVTLAWKIIPRFSSASGWAPQGATYRSNLYFIGFVGLTVAITSGLYIWFRAKISIEDLTVGAMIWWLILAVLTSLYLPGGSYLFTWPLLFSLIGLAFVLSSKDRSRVSPGLLAVLLVCALPAVLLLTPTIYQVFVALSLNSIGILAVLIGLLLGLLIPHVKLMAGPNKWLLPAASLLIGIALLAGVSLSHGADADHPALDSIFYGLNADTGTAVWASFDKGPDEWTSQFFSSTHEEGTLTEFFHSNTSGKFLKAQAPTKPLAPPDIALTGEKVSGGTRTLSMHITSARQAAVIAVYIDSKVEVLGASVNGRQIGNGKTTEAIERKNNWEMRYYALPPEGLDLTLELNSTEPVKMRVVDQSYGLPELDGQPLRPRPAQLIPGPVGFNDSTFVSKSFAF